MVRLEGVTFAYPQGQAIFEDYHWQAQTGEAWAVLGPSGCGKSTLLYLLAGLRFPKKGRVLIFGELVSRPRPQTGLILQDYGLLPWQTVRQNIGLGLSIRRFYGPDGTHAPRQVSQQAAQEWLVDSWLARLGLEDLADKYPGQLSGGQRQRAAIARTLILQPDLLLMDEPFSSLDVPTRESLQSLTLDLCREQGVSLVIVTHNIEEAAFIGEKILLLGKPPHLIPEVVQNPLSGQANYRQSGEYFRLVQALRSRMGAA